jgi:hypothetical protein
MLLAGYFLGSLVENTFGIKLDEHIDKVVIVVVLLSILPMIVEFWKARRERKLAQINITSKSEV